METPGSYLPEPKSLTPEQIASSKDWLLSGLAVWKRAFKPDSIDLICMAVAMEEIAGILRYEASSGKPTDALPSPDASTYTKPT